MIIKSSTSLRNEYTEISRIAKDITIYRVLHGRRYHDALLDQ